MIIELQTSMSKLRLHLIISISELEAVESEWEKFRVLQGISNMCLSFIWLNLWCKHYLLPQDKLIIHCYYDEDKLVGIFPVYLKKISMGYQLRFIATGEVKQAEICSEFQDFMLVNTFQQELLSLFSQAINTIPNIISCTFNNVLTDSIVESWLDTFSSVWRVKKKSIGIRYVVLVEKDQSAQLGALKSKTTKKQAKQYLDNNDCVCEYLTDKQSLDDMFTELVNLHNDSWKMRDQHGAFENKKFRDFHYQFATEALQNNKLVMFKILCKDRTLAIFYGVIDGDILYYYQSGILRQSVLPAAGVAMHIEALAFAQNNKLEKYDLMKGKSDSYKQRIVKNGQSVLNLVAFKKQYSWLSYYWKLKLIFSQSQ
jgi:CelD/BcsL family acetyltransferase involved in cellulose biosynthesis